MLTSPELRKRSRAYGGGTNTIIDVSYVLRGVDDSCAGLPQPLCRPAPCPPSLPCRPLRCPPPSTPPHPTALVIQGDTDALYMQEVCLVHPELLEFTQTLIPETSRAEAGLGGAGPSEDAGGNGGDDNDDDEEGGNGKSLASKLGEASKTKRADARRKQAAKATLDTYLPMIRSQLASGSADGGSAGGGSAHRTEGGEMFAKERAQAALDFDHSRAASKSAEVMAKHEQLYTITRQKLLEERQAEVPDDIFIAQLERNLKKHIPVMQAET